jgi:hypothetical protein
MTRQLHRPCRSDVLWTKDRTEGGEVPLEAFDVGVGPWRREPHPIRESAQARRTSCLRVVDRNDGMRPSAAELDKRHHWALSLLRPEVIFFSRDPSASNSRKSR